MNVPQLRFKGFEEEWESKKIKDLGEIGRGKSKHRPRNDSRLYGVEYPFIQTSDIKKAGLFLSSYSQAYSEFGFKQSKLWPKGTLCITIAANIAETAILDIEACFPDSIIGFTATSDKSDVVFIKKYFEFINPTLQKMSEGVAQSNLNLEKLASINFNVPSLTEQKKVALFFKLIEKKIELQQEKIEKLEQFKKGMMQKIFSQELRFKDEDGNAFPEWIETTLENLAEINTGNKDLQDAKENGIYPFFVRSQNLQAIDSYSYDGEAILIPGDGNIGQIFHYINGKFDYHQRVYKISDFNASAKGKYIYFYLKQFFLKEALKNSVKATVDSLRLPTIKGMHIKLPHIAEQIKVVQLLTNIDEKIEKEKEKLMVLEEQKRGFMWWMFV